MQCLMPLHTEIEHSMDWLPRYFIENQKKKKTQKKCLSIVTELLMIVVLINLEFHIIL
jgi:hypothetical protein